MWFSIVEGSISSWVAFFSFFLQIPQGADPFFLPGAILVMPRHGSRGDHWQHKMWQLLRFALQRDGGSQRTRVSNCQWSLKIPWQVRRMGAPHLGHCGSYSRENVRKLMESGIALAYLQITLCFGGFSSLGVNSGVFNPLTCPVKRSDYSSRLSFYFLLA